MWRDSNVNFLGGFVGNLNIATAFKVELHGLVNAIKIVIRRIGIGFG